MRSCAEVLRLLASRPGFDEEAKDMAAFLVYNLYEIHQIIEESAHAWDERGYWKKSERLRAEWRWSRGAARKLEALMLQGRWEAVQDALLTLVPHFQAVTVTTITRNADWWCGAFRALRRKAGAARR